jgi:hypothetical protein
MLWRMYGRWDCDRRIVDLDIIGLGESYLLGQAIRVDKVEASKTWLVHWWAMHWWAIHSIGRISPRPVSWSTDGGIVPPRMKMARVTLLASLLAPPADEKEASHCKDTDQDHKSQDRERNDQSQVAAASVGLRRGRDQVHCGLGQHRLDEDSTRTDRKSFVGRCSEVAIVAKSFQDCTFAKPVSTGKFRRNKVRREVTHNLQGRPANRSYWR